MSFWFYVCVILISFYVLFIRPQKSRSWMDEHWPVDQNEAYYQNRFAAEIGGKCEIVLQDRTRCDIITDDYAIEADFGKKWGEAVGQALHYSKMTGKKPGILLIITKPEDMQHIQKIHDIVKARGLHDLKLWTVGHYCSDIHAERPVF